MFPQTERRRRLTAPRSRRGLRRQRRKGNLNVLLKLAVLMALLGALMTQAVLGTAGSRGPRVIVRPGQTLWSIASQHYPQTDPRDAISAIETVNHLSGPAISPGERLLLPAV